MAALVKRTGMRISGPNSEGYFNAIDRVNAGHRAADRRSRTPAADSIGKIPHVDNTGRRQPDAPRPWVRRAAMRAARTGLPSGASAFWLGVVALLPTLCVAAAAHAPPETIGMRWCTRTAARA